MQRKLAAILAADLAGFSRRMSEDEARTLAAVVNLMEGSLQPTVAAHGGRVFKTMGDGLLAIFDSAVAAVSCAEDLLRRTAAHDSRFALRTAVHMGDVLAAGEDVYGDGVNLVTRLEGLAAPGEILVSEDVFRAVRRKLPLAFEARGEQRLKNIPDPLEVYAARPLLAGAAARPPAEARSDNRASIIVLPFANLSQDRAQEYFCDGLTQDITTDLSKFANLFVFAANSAFSYKERVVRPSSLAEELGVRYLLKGSVQHGGGKVRLNAQLIEAQSENHLWAERLDTPLTDLLEAQEQLVRRIVSTLAVKVSASEMKRVMRKETRNVNAYDAFLHGMHTYLAQVERSAESEEGLLAAAAWFEQATRVDPRYARAWGWLAYTQMNRVLEGWAPTALAEEAERLAKKAVTLSPDDHDTHWALGFVYSASGRPQLGYAEYQKALQLNPNDADMLVEMAETLTALGRHDEAVTQIERAMQLNPHFPEWYRWALGWSLHHARDYARSNQQLELIIAPNNEVRLIMAANCARLAEAAERLDGAEAAQHLESCLRHRHEFLRRRPDWTLEKERRTIFFVRAEDADHWLESVRRAGLIV